MPSAMYIGEFIPLPPSSQLTSEYRSSNASDFIKRRNDETRSAYNLRLKIAQSVIDSPYDLIEDMEDCYLTDQAVIEITNHIFNRVWYNVGYGKFVDPVLNAIMDITDV